MEKHRDDYDAVEGHNSQLIIPSWLSRVPIFGQFSKISNQRAQAAARKFKKPYIAVSDAHRLEDAGISYIEFDDFAIADEDDLRLELKRIIKSGNFRTIENYEPYLDWANWVSKFIIGTLLKKDRAL